MPSAIDTGPIVAGPAVAAGETGGFRMAGLTAAPPVAAGVALGETLAPVAARNEYLKVRHGRPAVSSWLSASALGAAGSPHPDRLLAQVGAAYETPRRDVMASCLLGSYGWQVVSLAVGAYLGDRRLPSLAPENVLARFDDKGNAEELALLSDRFTAFAADPAPGAPGAATVEDRDALCAVLLAEIEGHLAPLIDVLRARAPLGKRAMWLSVADDIAWNVIHHGKDALDPVSIETEVAALTQAPGAP